MRRSGRASAITLAVLMASCGEDRPDNDRRPPEKVTVPRASFTDSVRRLQVLRVLEAGERTIPPRMPRFDDDPSASVNIFRARLADADLSSLTLPRSFFGRSEITKVDFTGSDLSESNMCWNNFTDVSLAAALLTGADLRASVFVRVRFDMADLRGADLRLASFDRCSFIGAKMDRVRLTKQTAESLLLHAEQRSAIQWEAGDGPVPDGG